MTVIAPRKRSGRSEKTRDSIILAAAKVLAEHGYEATSLELIALEAGVTKGTIYYHFDAKETIYASVVLRYLEGALARLNEAARRNDTAFAALGDIVRDQIDDTLATDRRYVQYQELLHLAHETHVAVREAQRLYERRLAEVIAEAQEEGALAPGDPRLIAMLVIGSIGRTARWYRADGRVSEEEFRQTLTSFIFDGLTNR